jgi:hypothetical protein
LPPSGAERAPLALATGALVPLAETSLVRVWSFAHHREVAGDPGHEVFPCPTMIFTSAGSWQVASATGRGTASPAAVVLGNRGQEYRCRHDDGFADRNLVLELRQGDRPFAAGLAPVDETMHRLLRQLRRALAPPVPTRWPPTARPSSSRSTPPGWRRRPRAGPGRTPTPTPATGSGPSATTSSATSPTPSCRWPPWPGWPAGAPAT